MDEEEEITEDEEEEQTRKRHYHRRKKTKKRVVEKQINYEDIPGIVKKSLSIESQKFLKLIVGEHVTGEKPWTFITKERLEDDIDLHEETTELIDIKDNIINFTGTEILIGYVPAEATEVDEFYFCLTEEAAARVIEIINEIQEQRSERLQNTVEKTVGRWRTRGSEKEVELIMNKANRPLIEIELETDYPIMSPDVYFKLRLVEDARDGYVEMLCKRYTFNNLYRKRIERAIQSAPFTTSTQTQTVYTYPQNAWTQYNYELVVPMMDPRILKKYAENVRLELLPYLSEELLINSTINMYSNDFEDLVVNFDLYQSTEKGRSYDEVASLHEVELSKGKIIGHFAWHPMWTGILAFSYSKIAINLSQKGQSNSDEVTRAVHDANYVLLWSTQDTLQPKLLLEAPRDVTAISFCPYDENVVVGGCANGQIVVWDITNKLKQVEEVEVLTLQQQNYRKIMHGIMGWMKLTQDSYKIRPVVVSNIKLSHTNTVTGIEWIQPQYSLTKMGHFLTNPPDELSMQFITSGTDGCVMVWDLLAKPTIIPGTVRPPRKLKRLKRRPSALTLDVSPYKILNRIFKPFYMIDLKLSHENRPFPITSFTFKPIKVQYVEKDPIRNRKVDVMNDRIHFVPEFRQQQEPLYPEIKLGTLEGDIVFLNWEGFEYSTGAVVTKEEVDTENFAKYHDGTVVSLEQNEIFHDIILSVGGMVFAIWKIDFPNRPIFWRRSKSRYTFGSWLKSVKTYVTLVNEMGFKEVWDVTYRSTAPIWKKRTFNVPILHSIAHPMPSKLNLVITTTTNASASVYLYDIPGSAVQKRKILAFKNYIEREVTRKKRFQEWQQKWSEDNPKRVIEVNENEILRQKKFQQQQRAKGAKEQVVEEKTEENAEAAAAAAATTGAAAAAKEETKKEHITSEQLQEEWKNKEKERMSKVLLELKHLNPEILQQQQIPLKKLEAELLIKKEKQKQLKDKAEEIYMKSVAMNFPEAIRPKTPPPHDPYAAGDLGSAEVEKCWNDYQKLAKKCKEAVAAKPYMYNFQWSSIIDTGHNIRRYLDMNPDIVTHRKRYESYKSTRKVETEVVEEKPKPKKTRRIIRYVTTDDGEEEEQEIIEEFEEQEPIIDFDALAAEILSEEEENEG